jgi:hypothetical protein
VLLLQALCAALRAGSFVLIDAAGQGHGPYPLAQESVILGGAFTVAPRGSSATFRATTDNRNWGPFFFTNQAVLRLGGQAYEVLLTTPDFNAAYAAGADTRLLAQVVAEAVTNAEARAGIESIEAAKAGHAGFRNTREVAAALANLEKRATEEEAMKAAGKVKFEGQWLDAKAAEKRLAEQEAVRMRAQGFVQEDGEWMSVEAAREHRLEKARAAARQAAEERRRFEQNKCRRCNGTGTIYFEIRPSPVTAGPRGASKPPDLRIEKPGLPPRDSKYAIERDACPDCKGTGRRQ